MTRTAESESGLVIVVLELPSAGMGLTTELSGGELTLQPFSLDWQIVQRGRLGQ